jgi:fructoselysine-6-P-deglycase FrlB-like protein
MGRPYREELDYLPQALRWAQAQDINLLKRAVSHLSGRALLPIGSGGSFTAAAFAARLHTGAFARVANPITPLDCFNLPQASGEASAALLISAEGKNKDILAAAKELIVRRIPAVALTLTYPNLLTEYCDATGAATSISYQMPWGKDGYLATNSLAALLLLLLRAFNKSEPATAAFAALLQWFESLRRELMSSSDKAWVRSRVLVLHGNAGGVGAIDLESKLTESALAFAQIANFRQFAHGRHLQLANPLPDLAVIAMVTPGDQLASSTLALLPSNAALLLIDLPKLPTPFQELASVLAAMAITENFAQVFKQDPGQPDVGRFGRDLHALDFSSLISTAHSTTTPLPLLSKWPDARASERQAHAAAATDFIRRLGTAQFKAVLCDFDGTFCDTILRFAGLDSSLVPEMVRLLESGIRIGFATGRGDSLINVLQTKLPPHLWSQITVGCCSGSAIFQLDAPPAEWPSADPRLNDLGAWLKASGVIANYVKPKIDCGQMGLRALPPRMRERVKIAVVRWAAEQRIEGWRVLSSEHSVDVLTEVADKRLVLKEIAKLTAADPQREILRLGDAGDLGGNDYELLADGLGLSVGSCSPDLTSCWDLLPGDRRGVQGTLLYLKALDSTNGLAKFNPAFLHAAQLMIEGAARKAK